MVTWMGRCSRADTAGSIGAFLSTRSPDRHRDLHSTPAGEPEPRTPPASAAFCHCHLIFHLLISIFFYHLFSDNDLLLSSCRVGMPARLASESRHCDIWPVFFRASLSNTIRKPESACSICLGSRNFLDPPRGESRGWIYMHVVVVQVPWWKLEVWKGARLEHL